MPFPQTPLPVLISIAPGAEPAASPDVWEAAGLWTDITDKVRVDSGINIEVGRQDEANQVDTSKCTFIVDNRDGDFSPRNPMGQWFGRLKKNTPVRIVVQRATDNFTRTTSNGWGVSPTGNTWNATDIPGATTWTMSPATGAQLAVTNTGVRYGNILLDAGSWDVDIRARASVAVLPTGESTVVGVTGRGSTLSSSAGMTARVRVNTTGTVDLILGRTETGFITLGTVTAALTGYTAGKKFWVRLQSFGQTSKAKLWYDGTAEPSTWPLSFTETATNLTWDAKDSDTYLASRAGVFGLQTTGNLNNPLINFWDFQVTNPIFVGNVIEWPVRWDQSGNDCYVPVTASGVIRRLSQGQAALNSPLFKTISGASPYAYWPFEDESGSTSAVGIGRAVKPATVYEATFGFDGPPILGGASSTIEVTENTTISGLLPSFPLVQANGWQMSMFIYAPALPPPGVDATIIQVRSSGTTVLWSLRFNNTGQIVLASTDADGSVNGTIVAAGGTFSAGTWMLVEFEVFKNGANVDIGLNSINMNTGVIYNSGLGIGAGTVGIPSSWSIFGSSTSWPGAGTGAVSHVAFFPNHNVLGGTAKLEAGRGYAGEVASARVKRLCAEQGVALELLGVSTTAMGPQRSDTFLGLLRECEDADLGVLYETVHTPGLGYRPRTARYNTEARMALDFAQGHIAEPPEPTDDDQNLRNDWTVSRPAGSYAQVIDSVHIAEQGLYDDSAEINVATDDVLVDHASMRVYLGTIDELRWPRINLDFAKNPQFIGTWLGMQIGSRMTIVNTPGQLPGMTVDVIIEGYTQRLSPFGWDVELNCSPATTWASFRPVAGDVVDSDDPRIDSDVSTTNASLTASATSMAVVRPTGAERWDTSGTQVPFDVDVAGERMTVTAVTGTGTVQTFTVTRSVNGITKAHIAGEPVVLWSSSFAAL